MLNGAMKINKFFLIIFLIFLSGCATFHSASYFDNNTYPSTRPESVKIFYTTPPRNFVKIGELSASGAPASNVDNMIEKLKIEAAEMGGDAILLKTSYNYHPIKQTKESIPSKTEVNINIAQQSGPYTVLPRPQGTYATDPGWIQNIPPITQTTSETLDASPDLNGIVIKFTKEQ
jgi:hypothetical protein